MKCTYSLLLLLISLSGFSQTLATSRSVDWTLAGLRDTTSNSFLEIDMLEKGAVGDSNTPNDFIIANVLNTVAGQGAILNFPAGNFLFNNMIKLTSNIIIRGQGADNTTFTMDLGGTGHAIVIRGATVSTDTTSLIEAVTKDSDFIRVFDSQEFLAGNWVQIIQKDSNLVTSSWALNTVGQIVKIKSITNNTIVFESPLRMKIDTARSPYIQKIIPVENVGIECLKIYRMDDAAPEQTSNINFSYATNCWVNGIESENCTFSHIAASHSSNLSISKSYFHHAFGYGGGGRAYGVMLQATSNECLIENNVFKHLRHSMILQSGANGNVFTYNYSFDPYWDTAPNDASGDMVLHGNYVYANLFEHNICQNIVIDDSHGPNGPYNTFFRNRAEGFGIFFSATNSPNQNFFGNDIPNTTTPYSFVNYNIQGTGHFLHGNNNKGNIHPTGTEALSDISYVYTQMPDFIINGQWAGIGTPNIMGVATIPPYERYATSNIFSNSCGNVLPIGIEETSITKENVLIFPNPMQSEITIESSMLIESITIINSMGKELYYQKSVGFSDNINTLNWKNGAYHLLIKLSNNTSTTKTVVKIP